MAYFRQEGNALLYRYDAEEVRIEGWGTNALRVRATKQAAFTEEVYHGTRRGFGFTKYDPSKSNTAPALCTSGDLAVARTYFQDDGVTNISLAQELGLTAGNYRFFANTEGMIEILCWHYLFSRLGQLSFAVKKHAGGMF